MITWFRMYAVSKQRPSRRLHAASFASLPNGAAPHRAPRVFRNFYTRDGRRFLLGRWSVKIQHHGLRRTVSLHARAKSAALAEARALRTAILAKGWESALRDFQHRKTERSNAPQDFADRLLTRRYLFPPSGHSEKDLAVRFEHEGVGYWFPLATGQRQIAIAKAKEIHEAIYSQGWERVCQEFSRELMLGFAWCSDPLLWTYTTVHTLTKELNKSHVHETRSGTVRILLVEEDAGVRRALEWCMAQHAGFLAVSCSSAESLGEMLGVHKPGFVLLNRNLAARAGFDSPDRIAPLHPGLPALTYSVAADGDKLFASTPGGASGYLLKRVSPTKILEPILRCDGTVDARTAGLLSRVKSYFRELLLPRSDGENSDLAQLTRREQEVLVLLSKGYVDKEIAQALGISMWTVHGHVKSIFERLHVRTRTEAVVRYLEK